MKFTTNRDTLLRPLQLVTGVVERRQTCPCYRTCSSVRPTAACR